MAWIGDSGRNWSSASAGDSGLLPGMVSSPDRVTGGEECMPALISWGTDDVSHRSKALSVDCASLAGKSSDDLAEPFCVNLIRDEPCPTLVEDEFRKVDVGVRGVRGVRGGDASVGSCELNDSRVVAVVGRI